jgi:hypothetical protein
MAVLAGESGAQARLVYQGGNVLTEHGKPIPHQPHDHKKARKGATMADNYAVHNRAKEASSPGARRRGRWPVASLELRANDPSFI